MSGKEVRGFVECPYESPAPRTDRPTLRGRDLVLVGLPVPRPVVTLFRPSAWNQGEERGLDSSSTEETVVHLGVVRV